MKRAFNMKYIFVFAILMIPLTCFSATRIYFAGGESTTYANHFMEQQYGTAYLEYWDQMQNDISQSATVCNGDYSVTYDPWLTDDPHTVVGIPNLTYGNLSNFDLSSYSSRYWYFRWYERWQENITYDASIENKMLYVGHYDDEPTDGDFVFTFKKNGPDGFHVTLKDIATYSIISNPYATFSGGSLDDLEWHKMEVFLDVGTGNSDGDYWIKIDDSSLFSESGLSFNSTIHSNPIHQLNGWPSNAPRIGDVTGNGQTWLDDMEIYTLNSETDLPADSAGCSGSTPSTGSPLGGNSHFNNIGTGNSSINFK